MPEESTRKRRSPPPLGGIPRIGDLIDVSDEMIAFVEKYQQVWHEESRAMLALGELLGARADSLRAQVELMRMGTDAARRYAAWSEALLGLRPDALARSWMQAFARPRPGPEDEGKPAGGGS